jgi:hypothetical protein
MAKRGAPLLPLVLIGGLLGGYIIGSSGGENRGKASPQRLLGETSDSSVYYRNCDAARAAGAAPLSRGDPGYRSKLDRDGDGTACEPYYGN